MLPANPEPNAGEGAPTLEAEFSAQKCLWEKKRYFRDESHQHQAEKQ
jgi:hypothetical protein